MNIYSARESDGVSERTGQLIRPPGFEDLLAVLKFKPLDEFSAANDRLYHLISLTVTRLALLPFIPKRP
jgi:hypothetical protein